MTPTILFLYPSHPLLVRHTAPTTWPLIAALDCCLLLVTRCEMHMKKDKFPVSWPRDQTHFTALPPRILANRALLRLSWLHLQTPLEQSHPFITCWCRYLSTWLPLLLRATSLLWCLVRLGFAMFLSTPCSLFFSIRLLNRGLCNMTFSWPSTFPWSSRSN